MKTIIMNSADIEGKAQIQLLFDDHARCVLQLKILTT